MKRWEERPAEIASLMNPAFCSLVLREFAKSYRANSTLDVDILLCFLALPMVLHTETRNAFPMTTGTSHAHWLQEHQHLRIGFANRCRAVAPFVREAIDYGAQSGALKVTQSGRLIATSRRAKSNVWKNLGDTKDCLHGAKLAGKWLARLRGS